MIIIITVVLSCSAQRVAEIQNTICIIVFCILIPTALLKWLGESPVETSEKQARVLIPDKQR